MQKARLLTCCVISQAAERATDQCIIASVSRTGSTAQSSRKLCASATHVMRQERPNTHPGETARDSATIKPTIADRSEPTASIAAPQPIALRPIGSSNQPLRLEIQKPARLPLQIEPEEAARESFILVLSGAPTGTTLSGAARIVSDTWFLAPGSSNQLEITLPEWSTSVFEINIVLRRTTGLLAAQTTAWSRFLRR
jgi:hypothetical protein